MNDKDLKIDTYRPDGMSANLLGYSCNPAVRITHIPTGLSVKCQDHSTLTAAKYCCYEKLLKMVEAIV